MHEQNELTHEQRELEASLGTMIPVTRADPIAAAFAAGRNSGRRHVRLWQSAAVMIVAIGIGFHLVSLRHERPSSSNASNPAIVINQPVDGAARAVFDQSLLMLQRVADEKGLDGLPTVRRAPSRTIKANEIL